jgi:hypothetical protein
VTDVEKYLICHINPLYNVNYPYLNICDFRNETDMFLESDNLNKDFLNFFLLWFVRLLALRPLLAYCASLG